MGACCCRFCGRAFPNLETRAWQNKRCRYTNEGEEFRPSTKCVCMGSEAYICPH